MVFDRVIVDTGADASALPWSDCERLELDPRDGAPGLMGGVGETVKAAYGPLYTEVSRLLREADPIRLIVIGAPDDEYDPEVSTILPRLCEAKSPDDVQRIVHEEFAHWFGAEIAGSAAQYAAVSKNIWEAWNKFPVST